MQNHVDIENDDHLETQKPPQSLEYEGTNPVLDYISEKNKEMREMNKQLVESVFDKDKMTLQEFIAHCKGQEDPMHVFGSGIVTYFRIQKILLTLMFIITLLLIPVYYIYYTGNMFNDIANLSSQLSMMGNLG